MSGVELKTGSYIFVRGNMEGIFRVDWQKPMVSSHQLFDDIIQKSSGQLIVNGCQGLEAAYKKKCKGQTRLECSGS